MAAGIYNIIIEQGETWERDFTWTDSDGNTPDLSSGYTASLVISDKWNGTAMLTLTDGSGITLGASGSIAVSITRTQTLALTHGDGVWTLEVTKTSTSKCEQLLRGKVVIEPTAGS